MRLCHIKDGSDGVVTLAEAAAQDAAFVDGARPALLKALQQLEADVSRVRAATRGPPPPAAASGAAAAPPDRTCMKDVTGVLLKLQDASCPSELQGPPGHAGWDATLLGASGAPALQDKDGADADGVGVRQGYLTQVARRQVPRQLERVSGALR